MKMKDLEMALRSAGSDNDHKKFIRLYSENRISFQRAKELFNKGKSFSDFLASRDNGKK